MTTRVQLVVNALSSGKEMTANQIAARTKVSYVQDAVYRARQEGYKIFTNRRKNSNGDIVFKYRMAVETTSSTKKTAKTTKKINKK